MSYRQTNGGDRGFLPVMDPLLSLSDDYLAWEQLGSELPKLLVSNQLRTILKNLPLLSIQNLHTDRELERAMLLLSYFGHAYVFGAEPLSDTLPSSIAVPWFQVSQKLKRPPVLSYASYALNNWRRLQADKEVELGNIVLLQNFLAGLDEEWFVLVHVDIEMKAAPALQRFPTIHDYTVSGDADALAHELELVVNSLNNMCLTLDRMVEHCDPYIYYNRVRPYIHGWKDNPSLPQGLIYQGVAEYQMNPQKFRGETGAQSTIIPSFDALLGITHKDDPLRIYLMEMRNYMPLAHRQYLQGIEEKGSIRQFIIKHSKAKPILSEQYNNCVTLLSRFRQTHLNYAAHYIQKQHQTSQANPTQTGTGGTPFMSYLRKHKDETLSFLLS